MQPYQIVKVLTTKVFGFNLVLKLSRNLKKISTMLLETCIAWKTLQRQRIIKSLIFSPSNMMMIEELTDVVGIDSREKDLTFCKHFKWSFLIGKNALPVYIKDPPKGSVPSMKREITLVLLKEDSEECAFDRAVKKQMEISQKHALHTIELNFPEMKETYKLFDEKSKLIGKSLLKSAGFTGKESVICKSCTSWDVEKGFRYGVLPLSWSNGQFVATKGKTTHEKIWFKLSIVEGQIRTSP